MNEWNTGVCLRIFSPPVIAVLLMKRSAAKRTLFLFSFIGCLQFCSAQGTFTVVSTGDGQPLISQTRSVTVGPGLQDPRLIFELGFATDENVVPGVFFDSFTVTIQDLNALFTAIYLTVDASGFSFAPVTPGTLFIEPASIMTVPVTYPSLQPILAQRTAYRVDAIIPAQFLGRTLNVYFDLFDNLDGTASQAWFTDPQVTAVPEPAAWKFVLFAVTCGWGFRRFKK